MHKPLDILTLAHRQPFMVGELEVLQEVVRFVPGSVKYSINRYKKHPLWSIEDTGVLIYHYEKNDPSENYLELKFCVSGNIYCRQKQAECNFCNLSASKTCVEKVDSV